jgi:uncharacterized membrane protein YcaP (DUF421 family)
MWSEILGLNVEKLQPFQMAARASFIFFLSLLLIRIAGIRTLGRLTAFDHLTALMLGAVLGRAIVTADQPFAGSLAAAVVIVVLHRAFAWLTFRSRAAGRWLKGDAVLLVKDGEPQKRAMGLCCVTMEDIEEAFRTQGKSGTPGDCREIKLERSGGISFKS